VVGLLFCPRDIQVNVFIGKKLQKREIFLKKFPVLCLQFLALMRIMGEKWGEVVESA